MPGVGGLDRPVHPIVERRRHEIPPGLEPAPGLIGSGGDVVGAGGDVGEPELLEHVGADAVGAQRNRQIESARSGIADRVVHVRPRVVHEGAAKTVIVRQVDAVDDQPVVITVIDEPLPGVGIAFRNVHMHPDVVLSRQLRRRGDRVVGAGEGGMQADISLAFTVAQEPIVLGQAGSSTLGAVTVGDTVRARDPNADLLTGVGDHRERALDRIW